MMMKQQYEYHVKNKYSSKSYFTVYKIFIKCKVYPSITNLSEVAKDNK